MKTQSIKNCTESTSTSVSKYKDQKLIINQQEIFIFILQMTEAIRISTVAHMRRSKAFIFFALYLNFLRHTNLCQGISDPDKAVRFSLNENFGRKHNKTLAYTDNIPFSRLSWRLPQFKQRLVSFYVKFQHEEQHEGKIWLGRYPKSSWSKIIQNIRLTANKIQAESVSSAQTGTSRERNTGFSEPQTVEESQSVHLKLYERASSSIEAADPNANLTTTLEYKLPDGTSYLCLGSNRTKFAYFLQYQLGDIHQVDEEAIITHELEIKGAEGTLKDTLLKLWETGRLLAQKRVLMDELRQQSSFRDLLMAYTKRVKIRNREQNSLFHQELRHFLVENFHGHSTCEMGGVPVKTQLEDCYFQLDNPVELTRCHLKNFLEWFRSEFPYYYDECMHCGNTDRNSFLGYVHPTKEESSHQAGRTEMYHCGLCGQVSRFARYNTMAKVLDTRKGRCGEYSVLMLQFLEALGYQVRWVVDWADHVWVEVLLEGHWTHLDPCEAALDQPLLYESWNKNSTYILAFTEQEVQDVTAAYTSDIQAALGRRDIDDYEMQHILHMANVMLRSKDPDGM